MLCAQAADDFLRDDSAQCRVSDQIVSIAHLPRPLDLKEVAKIKAICPDLLELAYVPTSSLDASDKKKRKRDEDIFELPTSVAPEYTLLLEFSDGKVNTGKVTRRGYHQPRTKPENETMKMITQRNEMFQRAVNTLLTACSDSVCVLTHSAT